MDMNGPSCIYCMYKLHKVEECCVYAGTSTDYRSAISVLLIPCTGKLIYSFYCCCVKLHISHRASVTNMSSTLYASSGLLYFNIGLCSPSRLNPSNPYCCQIVLLNTYRWRVCT